MSLAVIEPATEQVLSTIEVATVEAVDEAVALARSAQRGWAAAPPHERAEKLRAVADAIEANSESLASIESRNNGMPLGDARGAVANTVHTFRFFSASPERLCGSTIPVSDGVDMTFREPIGVVGLITPWNFPLSIAAWKVAPALATGNAVVLKPAELTPLSTVELARIANEAGLPDGLLNVVVGPGRILGTHMVEHPDVGKIAFTGSTEVGREIARRAAAGIKRVTLELGGKSACIVFADADLRKAAEGLVGGSFGNAGQDCCARSRVFIQRPAVDEFLEHARDVIGSIRVGPPDEAGVQMGPLISASQRESVSKFVENSPIMTTGKAPDGPGFWFPPTALYPIDDDHRSVREEIFGPVVAILPFEEEEEVIRRANQTIYGLSGSIWTADGGTALRVARGMATGTISINSNTSVRVNAPFGGFKQSGLGRELGENAVEAYTEVKNVYYSTGE
jgi:acyl-CoA reductase-like NAD-dependent aldehyde dehydrogenase